jgi:peptide/nickel transport system permease protein
MSPVSLLQPTSTTQKASSRTLRRLARYILVRVATIAVTIVIGVFLTVVITNRGGVIEQSVQMEIRFALNQAVIQGWLSNTPLEEQNKIIAQAQWEMEEKAGLHDPSYLRRNLRWTFNVLKFDWGEVIDRENLQLRTFRGGPTYSRFWVREIILQHFPNTLILISTAYFLVFLIGVPLALYLSRKHAGWLDRVGVALSPISSVPSWVHGILLVMIFAVELHLLPLNRMYDTLPPATKLGYIPIVLKHMILPVLAILLNLFFQCVYTWRTFFLIYAGEDYVELARAKGVPSRLLERRYILRPTLPYVITSFALTLLSFWQMTTALEYFFDWPGIGRLYVLALNGGATALVIGLVVIFAYLLGVTVFFLDILYALVDPRLRIGGDGQTVRSVVARARKHLNFRNLRFWPRRETWRAPPLARLVPPGLAPPPAKKLERTISDRFDTLRSNLHRFKSLLREIVRYPSAVVGMVIIIALAGMTVYTVVAIPYTQLPEHWYPEYTGEYDRPENALPVWVNWFRGKKLPPMILQDSRDGQVSKVIQSRSQGIQDITITFTIQYPYGGFPQEMLLYFYPRYDQKKPFVSLTWITPDGREFDLGGMAIVTGASYIVSEDLPLRYRSPDVYRRVWQLAGKGGIPPVDVLFADPEVETYTALSGTYTLRLDGVTFDDGSGIDAKLVVIGQVYGLAGTDQLRRDLMIPMLWGMPIALGFGLLGALATTFISMFIAAVSTWFGGWLDGLIQRITEANIILPILAVGVMIYIFYGLNLWTVLGIVVLLNAFGSPVKVYRAAFLQVKEMPYIEAAQVYGASHWRIISRYLIPRIVPVLVPQLVALIPTYVFLEATLAVFGVGSPYLPTWGQVIYVALRSGAWQGHYYQVLEPVSLLLLTGLAFAMLGFALERIFSPRLRESS